MILEFCARKISVTTDIGTLGPQEKARNLQIQNAGASYKIITTQYGVVYVDLRLNFASIICLRHVFVSLSGQGLLIIIPTLFTFKISCSYYRYQTHKHRPA